MDKIRQILHNELRCQRNDNGHYRVAYIDDATDEIERVIRERCVAFALYISNMPPSIGNYNSAYTLFLKNETETK